jgi:hypothetical protein
MRVLDKMRPNVQPSNRSFFYAAQPLRGPPGSRSCGGAKRTQVRTG